MHVLAAIYKDILLFHESPGRGEIFGLSTGGLCGGGGRRTSESEDSLDRKYVIASGGGIMPLWDRPRAAPNIGFGELNRGGGARSTGGNTTVASLLARTLRPGDVTPVAEMRPGDVTPEAARSTAAAAPASKSASNCRLAERSKTGAGGGGGSAANCEGRTRGGDSSPSVCDLRIGGAPRGIGGSVRSSVDSALAAAAECAKNSCACVLAVRACGRTTHAGADSTRVIAARGPATELPLHASA